MLRTIVAFRPVGEMAAHPEGEIARLAATVSGEMKVDDVPLAPGVDLAAIKAGDDDPLEVVVEVPAGRSKRGWNYLPQTLKKIAGEVASKTAMGFLGHQRPEDVEHQFLPPATHWVGAKWDPDAPVRDEKGNIVGKGMAYFRGVVDAAAKDLKRWIRAGRVKKVSIFGMPTLRQVAGETQVVDYKLLSIDWTPLDRAGMPTRVVAVGEIDVISAGEAGEQKNGGGQAVTLQELLAQLKALGAQPKAIVGEMGWTIEQLAQEIAPEVWAKLQAAAKAVGEMAQVFGLPAEAKLEDLVSAAKAAKQAKDDVAKVQHGQLVDKVIGEMVVAEAARPLVKRMLQVPADADEAAIKKAVGEMLEAEDVKKALAGVFKETPITPKAGREADANTKGLVVHRARI